jgi:hypothetical protein
MTTNAATWTWTDAQPQAELTREHIQTANRLAREAIDARGVACSCGAWTTVAPGWHQPWCAREREEHGEFERVLATLRGAQ